jgi:diaminohydroxyphosphoribosylaminopyrimidine deaminase/5-amino-6-(5-phosphoribosylamino)uracil reductase
MASITTEATEEDRTMLARALELARLGRGAVSPNPTVGAVLLRDGEVIGEGHHAQLGGPHAEVAALDDARARGYDPRGATLYVSLEPCAHQGRQPPCTDAILAAGIERVVIGCDDPSEKASGRGPGILRDGGVTVAFADGADAAAARRAIQPFRKHARTGRPLVTLKSALSLDGFTATASGEPRWISGPESRALVHRWRAEADAICVGIGTALADDPLLTARETPEPGRQSLRVIFDSAARLPLDSQLVQTVAEVPVMVVAEAGADAARIAALRAAEVEVVAVEGNREARIGAALDALGARPVTSLLLEGGAELAGSFLDAGEVDELALFVAPILLGAGRPLAIRERGDDAEAERPLALEWQTSGEDLLATARMREW